MNKYINNDYILRKNKILNESQIKKNQTNQPVLNKDGKSFDQVLKTIKDKESLKFSKHAIERLKSRNIDLSKADVKAIETAVENAQKKGIKDALILLDDKVFIANTQNKTIITASDRSQLNDNVFTHIDGAVLI